ncbi:MAG: NAD(P)H-hydrate dehydratase [Xanthobacteraceae bacterium]|nr:NAD(P)H-hydrate dehydratase [Xanthobacteraceae bacterium]
MELLTTAEMAQADALAVAAGVPGFSLMTSAGRAVAQAAENLVPDGAIVVVAGPGNNGGDGFVAAAELARLGRSVKVILVGRREALKGDAAVAAAAWSGDLAVGDLGAIGRPALIVDALFGAGLDRPVEGLPKAAIEAMNGCGAPIVAVDLPSGVNGTTGAVMGVAVAATETVTFFRRKPAHLLLPGRRLCGRVRVVDIGIPADVLDRIKPAAFENEPQLWRGAFPVPRVDGHKYARGHVVVVSGGPAATGAARLAARASLRAGAGLVTLATPRDALAINASAVTAVMVRSVDTPAELSAMLADARLNACVIGPGVGVGPRTRELVLAVLRGDRAVVLDADALTSFEEAPEALFEAIKANPARRVVMTPHEGEFRRIFKSIGVESTVYSKLEKTRISADMSGAAAVLLKGPDTTVASPDGQAAIAANAPPWLATAGAGDVLSGIIAGLMAQGVSPFAAAAMGVWMHGDAAVRVGPGLIAEDLTEALPAVTRGLYQRFGIEMPGAPA